MAKVLISVDDQLLRQIDEKARRTGQSRSAYLAWLARRDTGAGVGPGAAAASQAAVERLARLFRDHGWPADAAVLIREERDQQ